MPSSPSPPKSWCQLPAIRVTYGSPPKCWFLSSTPRCELGRIPWAESSAAFHLWRYLVFYIACGNHCSKQYMCALYRGRSAGECTKTGKKSVPEVCSMGHQTPDGQHSAFCHWSHWGHRSHVFVGKPGHLLLHFPSKPKKSFGLCRQNIYLTAYLF